jgi:hypothetical protein
MGTEAFWIPAAIAAVSAGANYINQSNADKRQQNAQVTAMQNQADLRNQANNLVKQQAQSIATSNPAAFNPTGAFVQNLRRNVGGAGSTTGTEPTNFGQPTSALGPTTGASKRYGSDVATAGAQTEEYGNTYAGEQGALDAAINQRKNEGLQMQTLGTNLNTLAMQSRMQSFVDQLRAQAAGVPNPWVSLFSNAAGYTAGNMAKNAWFTPNFGNYSPASTAGGFNTQLS